MMMMMMKSINYTRTARVAFLFFAVTRMYFCHLDSWSTKLNSVLMFTFIFFCFFLFFMVPILTALCFSISHLWSFFGTSLPHKGGGKK